MLSSHYVLYIESTGYSVNLKNWFHPVITLDTLPQEANFFVTFVLRSSFVIKQS